MPNDLEMHQPGYRVLLGFAPAGDVLKWGKIVVGLICLIIIVSWLLSALGMGGAGLPHLLR